MVWQDGTASSTEEAKLAELIKAAHVAAGGQPLGIYAPLSNGARFKANDQAVRNYTGHTAPDGVSGGTIMNELNILRSGSGEIVGYTDYPDEEATQRIFNAFMASSGHKKIIENPYYTKFGVGAVKSGVRHHYVVLFIRPK